MSLDKAIRYRKARRRPYRRAAALDRTCRPGGACPWCRANRLYARRRAEAAAQYELKENLYGSDEPG